MTQTETAIALIQSAYAILGHGLTLYSGKTPEGVDPEKLKAFAAFMETTLNPTSKSSEEKPEKASEEAAGEVPKKAPKSKKEPVVIDPDWFRPGLNRHLTDAGIRFCYACWNKGMTKWETAKRMGIAWRAVDLRYAKFDKGEVPIGWEGSMSLPEV